MRRSFAPLRVSSGSPAWRFASSWVTAFLTRDGGQLGPVYFRLGRRSVQPYALPPWRPDEVGRDQPAVLKPLRGDFLCAPFGGNSTTWRGERHPAHGETAGARWRQLALRVTPGGTEFRCRLTLHTRPGRITKRILLSSDQPIVYQEHLFEGLAGPWCLGHHTTLKFPPEEASGRVATSRFHFGKVVSRPFEDPARGGYFSLRPGAEFRSLRRVPRTDGGMANLTYYPARAGYTDLVQLAGSVGPGPAWTAVTFPREGWLWFSLRRPDQLNSVILWHSNGGRHYAPWNGRHRDILGLECVTACFDFGLAESIRPNELSRRGIPTHIQLHADRPLRMPYIMGVVAVPRGFDTVRHLRCDGDRIIFTATSGRRVAQSVNLAFLHSP